jgi:G3E family GTPase
MHGDVRGIHEMSLFDRDKSADKLPVSVITGFLGSGKTTLLNALLRRREMGDSAVLINEFGAIGLDHLLVEPIDGEMVVMQSGCLCCTIRGDLQDTLRRMLARRDRGEVPAFRRILIETTGLADPAPVLQTLINNPLISHFLRLDAVVTTVDAVHGMGQLDQHMEAVKQAAIADRLLVTKTDLLPADADDGLMQRLRALNPGAPLLPCRQGNVEPERLFGAGPFDPECKSAAVRDWLRVADHHAHAGHDHGDHDHAAHHRDVNRHDRRIQAISLTSDHPLDWSALSAWLAELRTSHGESLLRVKGVLDLAGETGPVVIHGVQHVFHPPVALAAWPDDDRRSRLVFILRDLDPRDLETAWASLVATPSSSLEARASSPA